MSTQGIIQVKSFEFTDQKRNSPLKDKYLVSRRTIVIFLNIFALLAFGFIGAGLGIGFSSSSKSKIKR
jgi:hypothetical protein